MTKQDLARRIFEVSNLKGEFRLRSGQISSKYFDKYLFEVFVAKGPNLGCAMHGLSHRPDTDQAMAASVLMPLTKRGDHKDDKILDE